MFSNIYDSFNFLILCLLAVQKYKNLRKYANLFSENIRKYANLFSENIRKYANPAGQCKNTNPSLTGLTDWIEGQVIDVGHNPFMGLVISIKDNLGRIFFGQSKYFKIA